MKQREIDEKHERARIAREKAEAERAAKADRKRGLVDMNADKIGDMDSLLEKIQSGEAFRPDQRRKRQMRPAGGKFGFINTDTIDTDNTITTHTNHKNDNLYSFFTPNDNQNCFKKKKYLMLLKMYQVKNRNY